MTRGPGRQQKTTWQTRFADSSEDEWEQYPGSFRGSASLASEGGSKAPAAAAADDFHSKRAGTVAGVIYGDPGDPKGTRGRDQTVSVFAGLSVSTASSASSGASGSSSSSASASGTASQQTEPVHDTRKRRLSSHLTATRRVKKASVPADPSDGGVLASPPPAKTKSDKTAKVAKGDTKARKRSSGSGSIGGSTGTSPKNSATVSVSNVARGKGFKRQVGATSGGSVGSVSKASTIIKISLGGAGRNSSKAGAGSSGANASVGASGGNEGGGVGDLNAGPLKRTFKRRRQAAVVAAVALEEVAQASARGPSGGGGTGSSTSGSSRKAGSASSTGGTSGSARTVDGHFGAGDADLKGSKSGKARQDTKVKEVDVVIYDGARRLLNGGLDDICMVCGGVTEEREVRARENRIPPRT